MLARRLPSPLIKFKVSEASRPVDGLFFVPEVIQQREDKSSARKN